MTIDIDWDMLLGIFVALFALGGFMQGWWNTAIMTLFLVLLYILITQPELTERIIEIINGFIQIAFEFISNILASLGLMSATTATTATAPSLDPSDRTLYIVALLIIVVFAYFTSKITLGGKTISVGARIFGGILGALNGIIVVNLVKEFILGRFIEDTPAAATAIAPDTVSITVNQVPTENLLAAAPLLIVGVGIVVLALVVANRLSRKGRRMPWGYK
jgi:hypothetical protein